MKRTDPRQQDLPFAARTAERPNLVIEAGAGTGKTTRIVREIVEVLLAHPDLQPERIALVTFTEKAAGEIAERIRYALTDIEATFASGRPRWPSDTEPPIVEVAPAAQDVARRAITRHVEQIDRFRSQTIHSFCQAVLRSHAIAANLNPDFEIIQGSAERRFLDEAYAAWEQEETRRGASRETLEQWRIALQHFQTLARIRDTVFTLLPKRDLLASESYSLGDLAEAEGPVLGWLDAIRNSPNADVEASGELVADIVGYLREHRLPPGASLEEWIDYFAPISDGLERINFTTARRLKEILRTLTGRRDATDRHTIYERLVNHRAALALRAMTNRFVAFVDREKERSGFLDFDDLLLRTAELLQQEEVLRQVRAQYDYIFVDEFQDTDRVQARIFDRLARDDRNMLVQGRTVLVGDPKQGIYSFRRADPETYQETIDTFVAEGARRESLAVNYRSDPRLLDALNAMFGKLFDKPATENVARPLYTPLSAGRPASAGEEPRLTFLRPTPAPRSPDADDELAESRHTRQARAIAEWIQQRRVSEACGFGRFALLYRKMTTIEPYLEVFDRLGIPYTVPPTKFFLERPAAVDLLTVLRAISSPHNLTAVTAAARTPYFAVSDDAIARARLLTEGNDFAACRRTIESYAAAARHLSVAELIDRVVAESRVDELYAVTTGGALALRCLDRMREIAAAFDIDDHGSLAEFVAEIDRRRESGDESDPNWIDESEDAVRILTVHASKGLEFDSVILPDLSSTGRGEPIRAFSVERPQRTLLFTGALTNLAAKFRESSGAPLATVGSERMEAELDRLFYVAVTRARSEVVFVCDEDRNASFWKIICRIFSWNPKTGAPHWPQTAGTVLAEEAIDGQRVPLRFTQVDCPPLEESAVPHFQTAAWERMALEAAQPLLEPAAVEIETLPRAELARARAGAANRAIGIALHRVLELWSGAGDELDDLAVKVNAEMGGREIDLAMLRERVGAILASGHLGRILSARTLAREMPIHHLDERGAPVTGRIDRLLKEEGKLLVVDYKSGRPGSPRQAEELAQVARYCSALRTMTHLPCSGLLWYLETDEVVEVT